MLTHRVKRDPSRHVLYENATDFLHASEKWLSDPRRRRHQHTLDVEIDRSDSLLYEGVVPHVRSLAPLFSNPSCNPRGNKLILLTKTANIHYLDEIKSAHRPPVVSFSLNPESIADLWEGKWPDTGERITPSISKRLQAAKHAQALGFEIRVRVDPILTPDGWEEQYSTFVADIRHAGIDFTYWTLGTYRDSVEYISILIVSAYCCYWLGLAVFHKEVYR
jgi:hypothetical protein